jgi:NADH:ubiquinone reductase (H+-translocating)
VQGDAQPRVVIVGGGFGGLAAARGLARAPVRVTLVDRRNHHLFQPLLYQVATAALSPAEIAEPIRGILRRQQNLEVALGEVTTIDTGARRVELKDGATLPYDLLVLATGATHSYFGREEWAPLAPGLKTVEDALEIRRRFFLAFEAAERTDDAAEREALMTFVVIGAGPTGVEMAGAMAEIARRSLRHDFRRIDPSHARIVLVEGADRVLPFYPERLSERTRRDLERLGVEVRTGTLVTDITPRAVTAGDEVVPTRTVIWAAGVRASALGAALGAETDPAGRVAVGEDLTVPGHPDIFVIGDLAVARDRAGAELPALAPVAKQQGEHVARMISGRLRGEPVPPFRYRDRGSMATIGRGKAVAQLRGLQITGLVAWLAWLFVHIAFLIGFRNRIVVLVQWAWSYLTWQRGARLITGDRPDLPDPPASGP